MSTTPPNRVRFWHAVGPISIFFMLNFLASSSAIAVAHQITPSLTAAQLAAVQAQAKQIAIGLQESPVLKANGTVATTNNGAIETRPTSNSSLEGDAVMMQGITGMSGFKAAGNPGDSRQIFGGTGLETTYTDIPCSTLPGATRSAGGIEIIFEGCQSSGGTIKAVLLRFCTVAQSGNSCATTGYSKVQDLSAGSYTKLGNLSIGVGCNNSIAVCRLTIVNAFNIRTSAVQLTTNAQKVQNSSPNGIQTSLQNMANTSAYKSAAQENKASVDCYKNMQASFNKSGTVSTCNGAQSATILGGPAGGSCTPSEVCTEPTTKTNSWISTCTRTFPITTLSCTRTTPSLNCTDTKNEITGVTTSSCTSNQLAGGIIVGQEGSTCLQYGASTGTQAPPCIEKRWTAVYVFPGRAKTSNCTETPLPIAGSSTTGSCDLNPINAQVLCTQNGWVGRTLSNQQCQATTIGSSGATVFSEFDYQQKAGCGYCATATEGYPCQGAPGAGQSEDTCSTTQLTGCTLTSVTPESSAYGLTTSELETYSCSSQTSGCAAWKVTNSCINGNASYGTASMTVSTAGSGNSLNEVIAAEGIADGISKSGNASSINPTPTPEIFTGQDLRCTKPLGFVYGAVDNDCCQISLTRTGGSHPGNACTQNEVRLAAARRAHFTVYIGSYCSKETNFGFFSTCDQQTQTYCVFNGLLPKLVQVQGRQQLAQIARSAVGAKLETAALSYPFYSGQGGWTAPLMINGTLFAAYEEPSYCSSTAAEEAEFAHNPNAQACPATLQTWIAACENTGGCGALPAMPESGSGSWTITSIDPLTLLSVALTSHAIAKGACDTSTGQCAYEISAWPIGSTGRAMVSREVTVPAYAAAGYTGTPSSTEIGSTAFEVMPASVPSGIATIGELPAYLEAKVSTNGGSSWTGVRLPTEINSNFTLPGTDVTITGGCIAATGECTYQLTGSIAVSAKPWGSATHPDCSGFTLDQFSALDMGKMNLSEWIASVTGQMKTSTTNLVTKAQQQAAAGPTNQEVLPTEPDVVITPTEGLGPFAVTLTVGSNWPQTYSEPLLNTDPIYGVDINWGDCSPNDVAVPVPGGGFSAQHMYEAPNSPGICDESGPVSTPRNLTEIVVVTIHSRSGTHQVTEQVHDDWTSYGGGS